MTDQTSEAAGSGDAAEPKRFGFVALLGVTNAGKSTLVNQLVGTKVSIVSHKVQTTRTPVRGIVMHGSSQIVLVDLPGVFTPRRTLDRAMVDAAWGGAGDGDLVLVLIDAARGLSDDVKQLLGRVKGVSLPRIVVFNKVDRVERKEALLALTKEVTELVEFDEVFMISALDGTGIDDLKASLAARVPTGPWHYDEDDVTDIPLRMQAAEITREIIFSRLHQELPYSITVETTDWKTLKGGAARIEQTIFVERDGQKRILLGKGGSMIKHISMAARQGISEIADQPVHLFLFVKVRENWSNDPERYREMGLPKPKQK